ncbi:MAG TPA: penicillin-binding protein 2 [Candidatus Limnocylindria bacterium]|nr:penicillin-binding protein 2 [Candidatus Limnocylindria bacterium]
MRPIAQNIRALTLAIAIAFLMTSLGVGYWTLVAAGELSRDPFNPRLLAASIDRPRGRIVDAKGAELAVSRQTPEGWRRAYADRSLAHVTGYASFKYGASGIEGAYGASLIGQDAADPLGQMRARYLKEYADPGAVQLAIDLDLQKAVAAALGGRRGAIVVLDPRTGAVRASASLPNYEPGLVSDPAQQDLAWQQLNGNTERPLINRVAQGLYPPGSTMKIVTAAAALESGLDPKAKIRVDDPFQADPSWGTYRVRSSSQAHGDFDLSLAMQRSENIYFAKVGLQIGGARLAEYAGKFGIGTAPKCDLPAARGQISNTGALDRPTLLADTAYGQGELLVSPLQMALIAATIANGGVMPTPHYATAVKDASGAVIRAIAPGPVGQVVRADTARTVAQTMVDAVQAPGAFAFAAKVPGVNVAGKTGTAENPSGAPHGWFVGFAPAEAPTVAVAVLLENSPKGGEDAAPVGGAVLRAALGR